MRKFLFLFLLSFSLFANEKLEKEFLEFKKANSKICKNYDCDIDYCEFITIIKKLDKKNCI